MSRPSNPELIREILEVVADELQTKSISEITMRSIAERIGITPATIYYYFPSKEELLDNIKRSAVEELDEYVLSKVDEACRNEFAPASQTGSAPVSREGLDRQIEIAVRAFIEWFIDHPSLMELIFENLPSKLDIEEQPRLITLYRGPLAISELLKRGKPGIDMNNNVYSLDLTICMGMIYGAVKMHLNKRTLPQYWDDLETLTRKMVAVIKRVLIG